MKVYAGILLLLLPLLLSSCSAVEGIFELGFWAGVIVLLAVLFLLLYIAYKLLK